MPRPGPAAASPTPPTFPASPAGDPSPALSCADRLRRLALALDTSLADSPPGHPVALFLRDVPASPGDPPGEAELGWLGLDGRDPVDALLGFTAPPDWAAMGLVCSGRSAPLSPASRCRPQAVRVVVFLDRSGRATTVLRRRGSGAGVDVLDEPPEGLLGDSLRRALGVATAPPPASSARFWVAWWLDRVVAALVTAAAPGAPGAAGARAGAGERAGASAGAGRLRAQAGRGWPAVAALHPAAASPTPDLAAAEPTALAAATHALAADWPWARLRADGTPGVEGAGEVSAVGPPSPPPDIAAWMDDGMYARWCTGAVPDLLDTCHHLLTPEAWACLAATVAATVGGQEAGDAAGAGCTR